MEFDDDLSESDIERVLEWYEKDPGEALVGDEVLQGVTLDDLRGIFHPDPDDDPEMLLVYEVEEGDVARLQAFAEHAIDLSAHDYFVAAYRREENPE